MDPNAAVRDLRVATANGDDATAKRIRRELRDWVARGGFEPNDKNWRKY